MAHVSEESIEELLRRADRQLASDPENSVQQLLLRADEFLEQQAPRQSSQASDIIRRITGGLQRGAQGIQGFGRDIAGLGAGDIADITRFLIGGATERLSAGAIDPERTPALNPQAEIAQRLLQFIPNQRIQTGAARTIQAQPRIIPPQQGQAIRQTPLGQQSFGQKARGFGRGVGEFAGDMAIISQIGAAPVIKALSSQPFQAGITLALNELTRPLNEKEKKSFINYLSGVSFRVGGAGLAGAALTKLFQALSPVLSGLLRKRVGPEDIKNLTVAKTAQVQKAQAARGQLPPEVQGQQRQLTPPAGARQAPQQAPLQQALAKLDDLRKQAAKIAGGSVNTPERRAANKFLAEEEPQLRRRVLSQFGEESTGAGQVPPSPPGGGVVPPQPQSGLRPQIPIQIQTPINQPKPPLQNPQDKALIDRMSKALETFQPTRISQDVLVRQQRAERFTAAKKVARKTTGEAGFRAERAAMAGEFDKVQFDSIRGQFNQQEVDRLINIIKEHWIDVDYSLRAPTTNGLLRLFGQVPGKFPEPKQLELLRQVFGSRFVRAGLSQTSFLQRMWNQGLEIGLLSRAAITSFDFSFPGIQGFFFVGTKEYWQAFIPMFETFFSRSAFQTVKKSIAIRPTAKLMEQSGLDIVDVAGTLGKTEEAFQSILISKLPPGFKQGVEASNRAYATFANKLRADIWDRLNRKVLTKVRGVSPLDEMIKKEVAKTAKKLKRLPTQEEQVQLAEGVYNDWLSKMAGFVNLASGRGPLGKLEPAAKFFNATFFSPRLMSSRLLLMWPGTYIKLPPVVRKEAFKNMLVTTGTFIGILQLASLIPEVDVSWDMRSSDGGKVRIGDTRIDFGAGFLPFLRIYTQLITGQTKNLKTGRIRDIDDIYNLDPLVMLQRFFEFKTAPIVNYAIGSMRGYTIFGERFQFDKELLKRFIPIIMQDMWELYKDRTIDEVGLLGPAAFGLSIFGKGVQTFDTRRGAIRAIEKRRPRFAATEVLQDLDLL